MSKIKLTIVALSVITAGGFMTACNDGPRGTHTPIDATATNPSAGEAEGESEKDKLTRLMNERQERMDSISSKLTYISKKSYGEDKCSAADMQSLNSVINSESTETINGQSVAKKGSLKRVKTVGLSVRGLVLALNALVNDLDANQNSYCNINVASSVASIGQGYIGNFGREGVTKKDGEEFIDKAEAIANALSPLVSDQMNKIHSLEAAQEFQANVKALKDIEDEIESKIASLNEKLGQIRANFSCDDTNSNCSATEAFFASTNIKTEQEIAKAKSSIETYGTSSISGPGDSSLGSKIEVLEKVSADLDVRIMVADSVIKKQTSDEATAEAERQALRDQLAAEEAAAQKAADDKAALDAELQRENNIHYRNNGN